MGLDMYLNRRPKTMTKEKYETESHRIWIDEGMDAWRSKFKAIHEVAYWRKANWLHGYIVETFANGVDECQDIPLSKADVENILAKVKEACALLDGKMLVPQEEIGVKDYDYVYADDSTKEKVRIVWRDGELQGLAEGIYYKVEASVWTALDSVLPPKRGFFFGSYSYDKWYAYDVFLTSDLLAQVLEDWDDSQHYWYEASW